MKCALCKVSFNDGVQCSSCKAHLDFACANISESGYRRMGPDRIAKWKCPHCKIAASSPITGGGMGAGGGAKMPPMSGYGKGSGDGKGSSDGKVTDDGKGSGGGSGGSSGGGSGAGSAGNSGGSSGGGSSDPVTLEAVLKEVRDLKLQLAGLPGFFDEVKVMKSELTELKASCEYSCAKVDDFGVRLSKLEQKIPALERMLDVVNSTQNAVADLKKELGDREQWSRLNNVEVKGVPLRKDENLFSIINALSKKVGYEFPKSQINYISRVPTFNSKEKSIVVSFLNRYVKEEFIAAARAQKNLTASDIGFGGDTQRVFVNDHLTPEQKVRLTKTKALKKSRNYLYVWVKYCKIHVRKDDTSPVMIISKDSDLNKLT